MTDALDVQLAPLSRQLRSYARQTGCKALIDRYYGIGEMCAVTIVAELGDCRRFANSRDPRSGTAGMEMLASNCTSCSGDFGSGDVAGVRDPFAAFLLDGGVEPDPQAVGAVAAGGELVV